MTKAQEEYIDSIFKKEQRALIKKAIVKTEQLTPQLSVSTIRIGKDTSVLIFGTDLNDNVHYTMLSKETFQKLKKIKL